MNGIWSRDALRRIARTFIQAFLGLLLPGLLGWLHALTDWANDGGQAPFPDASSLAYLGVAAVGAGFVAVVTALMTGIEDTTGRGFLRTVPPNPKRPRRNERGFGTFSVALGIVIIVVAVGVWLL